MMKFFRYLFGGNGRSRSFGHGGRGTESETFGNGGGVSYMYFLKHFDLCSDELQREYMGILMRQERPDFLCYEAVPESLNGLTYGQLDDLRSASEGRDVLGVVEELARIVFGKELNVYDEDVNVVFGFVNFCTAELKRINGLFSGIKMDYTAEERAAGVEGLSFGSFGVLDWYARRMGMVNQNDVRDVAWVRVFQCMRNDNAQQLFERRLQQVYLRKAR